jgi:CDP-paratose 2-epimerase
LRVLVTGGAGFVGATVAVAFRREYRAAEVVVLDNLRRRGSELNVAMLADAGVRFVHGDVRSPSDLAEAGSTFDVLVDASAEPSVHAGVAGSPRYVVETNFGGTLNCLELVRGRVGAFFLLSSSRVYSMAPLRALAVEDAPTRFELAGAQDVPGAGREGIAEEFPTHLPRSFYGTSKLAAEMLVQEYAELYGMPAVINRCGLIAGPGQFGRSEQGVVTHWVARHLLGGPLAYRGYGASGKQVRDVLHPADLFRLVQSQLESIDRCAGSTYNVGGGREHSVSLLELTQLCRDATGREIAVGAEPGTSPVDIPVYISDHRRVTADLGWRPGWSPAAIVEAIAGWITENQRELAPVLG